MNPQFGRRHLLYSSLLVTTLVCSLAAPRVLATTLGASPALATLIGLFPFAGGILQGLVPTALRRSGGDLRRLTILIAAIGLARPLLYLAVVITVAIGLLPPIGGIALIGLGFGIGATSQAIAGANVQTWFGRILPERERRFVAPRALAIQFGLGSILLIPVALMVRVGQTDWGVAVYAPAFVGALISSLLFIRALGRLPRPGSVTMQRGGIAAVSATPVAALKFGKAIAEAGADLFFVQATVVSTEHIGPEGQESLDLEALCRNFGVPVVIGNCVTYDVALKLMRAGAAGVMVGIVGFAILAGMWPFHTWAPTGHSAAPTAASSPSSPNESRLATPSADVITSAARVGSKPRADRSVTSTSSPTLMSSTRPSLSTRRQRSTAFSFTSSTTGITFQGSPS